MFYSISKIINLTNYKLKIIIRFDKIIERKGGNIMIQLLVDRNSVSKFAAVDAFKKILTVIRIVGPILLIAALTLHVTQLMANPDDKKTQKKTVTSIIATIFLFFLPTIINLIMSLVGSATEFSACWNGL